MQHDGAVTRATSTFCHYLGTTRGGAYFRLSCLCCLITIKPAQTTTCIKTQPHINDHSLFLLSQQFRMINYLLKRATYISRQGHARHMNVETTKSVIISTIKVPRLDDSCFTMIICSYLLLVPGTSLHRRRLTSTASA